HPFQRLCPEVSFLIFFSEWILACSCAKAICGIKRFDLHRPRASLKLTRILCSRCWMRRLKGCERLLQNTSVKPIIAATQDFLREPVSVSVSIVVKLPEEMVDAQPCRVAEIIDQFQYFV